ncbi:S1C family serine protease [candidate division KSB1 bacterium]
MNISKKTIVFTFILIFLICVIIWQARIIDQEQDLSQNTEQGTGFLTSDAEIFQPENREQRINNIYASRRNANTYAVEEVSPAVVGISVKAVREMPISYLDIFFGTQSQIVSGVGSGFIISEDGYIVTNDHVVGDGLEIKVALTNGEQYDAVLVETDWTSDIALLKIEGNNFPTVKIGNSDDIIIGEWAIGLGNPFGLFDLNSSPSVTVGVVSALDRDFGGELGDDRSYQDMIQTDASINPGNSGGPLVNSNGEVIGVNAFILTGGSNTEGSIGIGFAIPINKVVNVVENLKRRAESGNKYYSGLKVENVTDYWVHFLRLNIDEGVLIRSVDQNSPASFEAKLQAGDIIVSLEGEEIKNTDDLLKKLDEMNAKAGTKLNFGIVRNNKLYETTLTLILNNPNIRR